MVEIEERILMLKNTTVQLRTLVVVAAEGLKVITKPHHVDNGRIMINIEMTMIPVHQLDRINRDQRQQAAIKHFIGNEILPIAIINRKVRAKLEDRTTINVMINDVLLVEDNSIHKKDIQEIRIETDAVENNHVSNVTNNPMNHHHVDKVGTIITIAT